MNDAVGVPSRVWRAFSLLAIAALLAPLVLVSSPPANADEDEDDEPPRGELYATIPWYLDDQPAIEIYAHRDGDRVRFTGEVLHPAVNECVMVSTAGNAQTVDDGSHNVVFQWFQSEGAPPVVDSSPMVDSYGDGHAVANGGYRPETPFKPHASLAPGDVFWVEFEVGPDVDWGLLEVQHFGSIFDTAEPECRKSGHYTQLRPGAVEGALTGSWLPREEPLGRAVPAGDTVPVRLLVDNKTGEPLTGVSVDEVEVVSLDDEGEATLVRDTSSEAFRPSSVLDGSGPGSVTYDDYLLTGDEPGRVELVAQLSGTDPDGQRVEGTVRNEFEVRPVSLLVEVEVRYPQPDRRDASRGRSGR